MIKTKKELIEYLKKNETQSIPGPISDVEENKLFDYTLLEDPEVGGIFFGYYPRLFASFLSMRKYEKDYFTEVYSNIVENKKAYNIEVIYQWVFEVIDAEGTGDHYLNDVNYIIELYKIDKEIIYLAEEHVLFSKAFLDEVKDSLYNEFNGVQDLCDIEQRLFDAVKALKRVDDLKEMLIEHGAVKRKRHKI